MYKRIEKYQVYNQNLLKILFDSEGCPDANSLAGEGFYMRLHDGEIPMVELRTNCGWNKEGFVHQVPESYVKEKIKFLGMNLHGIDESEITAVGRDVNWFFNTIIGYYLEVPRSIEIV